VEQDLPCLVLWSKTSAFLAWLIQNSFTGEAKTGETRKLAFFGF